MTTQFKQQFAAFLSIARALNRHGIIPTLYGSVGLHRVVKVNYGIDDLDIVIPNEYLEGKFAKFLQIMRGIGYRQYKDYPHTFSKGKILVDFEPENGFAACACADFDALPVIRLRGVAFRELTARHYLAIYKDALRRWEKKFESMKRKVRILEQRTGKKI